MKPKYKHQWYQNIYESLPNIREEARKASEELGLDELKKKIGMYPGSSSCPGRLPDFVLDAIVKANETPILPIREVEDEVRDVVKDVYGDEYDAAVTNTCEAALRVCFEILFAPPTMRKGDAYRARLIAPYGEDYEYMGTYGRPFPPKYKNASVDRSVSAGELGVEGKSLNNLDAVYVRYAEARYEVHGIKQSVVPLLTRVDVDKTMERIEAAAARHAASLAGFGMMGYDTPGYGNGDRDEQGVPTLLNRVGRLAERYDVPFLVDCASCIPFIGVSPKDINADVMTWSMDKPGRAPTSGLIIGKAESMVPVRKGLGLGGERFGEVSSHGKALFSLCDPGRDSVVGLAAYLKALRDDPERITKPIDGYHDIIVEEFSSLEPKRFRDKLIFTKSYSMGGTELNYAHTWDDGEFGIPIFPLEDSYAGTNAIASAQEVMGVTPATIYAGNMFLAPGLGTLDKNAELNEEYARLGVKSLVRSVEIVCKYAGLGD